MPEALSVGEQITDPHVFIMLPTGTTVRDGRNQWTKQEDGRWLHPNGSRWSERDFSLSGSLTIMTLPGGRTRWEVASETIEQVKWRFRTGALAAAEQHGVSVRVVEEALTKMGCGRDAMDPTLGRGVKIATTAQREALPDGSIIYSGNPRVPTQLAVFTKKRGQWVHILGEQSYLEAEVTIEAYGTNRERPDWLDRKGSERDVEQIQEFKATAWRVGLDLKRTQQWCGTYEDIVHRLGVSQADTRRARFGGMVEGQRVTGEETVALPVGSLLFWRHSLNLDRWALFLRVEDYRNRAGTVKVAGSDEADHDNYKRYMTIGSIADPDGDAGWLLPEVPGTIFDALPPGTVFTYRGGGEQRYIKTTDGRIQDCSAVPTQVPLQGRYQRSQFEPNSQFRIRRFVR